MKKLILFLLIGALLVLPLSGCFADNKQDEGTTPNNTTENTTPEDTKPHYNPGPDETTPEVTTPDNPPEVTTPNIPTITIPPEGNKNHPPIVEGEMDKDNELIETLSNFLDYYHVLWDRVHISFSAQINAIKRGTQPLHVVFDANDYYYACAYYSPTHDRNESAYCCFSEYTWVAYKSETAIQEFHNGMQFVVAFQINRAASVINILTGEPANDTEHFDIYVPVFENGVNTAVATEFDQNFVYLNGLFSDLDENTIYYSTSPKSVKDHSNHAIPCVYFDGRYYLSLSLGTLKADKEFDAQEVLSKESNIYKFGEYYDAIVGVMDMESYRIVNQDGSMRIYGLITFEDFVNGVLK